MLGLDEKLDLYNAGTNEKLTLTLTPLFERTVVQIFGD